MRSGHLLGLLLVGCSFQVPVKPGSCAGADCIGADLAPVLIDAMEPADLAPPPVDPGLPGPLLVAAFALQVPVEQGIFGKLQVSVLGPGADSTTLATEGAPFPLVVLSPDFAVPKEQYTGYAQRLASHGILTVLQAPRSELDHEAYRDDTRRLIDWLLQPTGDGAARLKGRADPALVGLAGHGLGGKISVLVAASDVRVKALFGIDPAETGSVFGRPLSALDGIAMFQLAGGRPVGLLGETTSSGTGCAPAGQGYDALLSRALPPAFAITFAGAAHGDFVDDFPSCGVCSACGTGTAPAARTHELSVKYAAAYFLWTLRGQGAAESFLSGAAFDRDAMTGAVSRVAR